MPKTGDWHPFVMLAGKWRFKLFLAAMLLLCGAGYAWADPLSDSGTSAAASVTPALPAPSPPQPETATPSASDNPAPPGKAIPSASDGSQPPATPAAEPSASPTPSGTPAPAITPTPTPTTGPVTVEGVVTDPHDKPVPGAQVDLAGPNGAVVASAQSDPQGRFKFTLPVVAALTIKVRKDGFDDYAEPLTLPTVEPLVIRLHEEMQLEVRAELATGPGISPSGANDYSLSTKDIDSRPLGENSTISQILTTIPGVALDQNENVHIRGMHADAQYQINGVMLPLSMYGSVPPLVNLLNASVIKQIDLLTGVLPAQYGFSDIGGVISIQTKDGGTPGGSVSLLTGQRGTVEPSVQYGGSDGKLNFYVSGLYETANTAFSSATPGPNAIHNLTNLAQGFGLFQYALSDTLKLGFLTAATDSTNQLPDVPGLTPMFALAGVSSYPSQNINSYLNFHDYLNIVSLKGTPSDDLKWQVAYTWHTLEQDYRPDSVGELLYQGVAATANSTNRDQSLQGDLTYKLNDHTLGTGFYYGRYNFGSDNSSLVFPVDALGNQTSLTPIKIINNFFTGDTLEGVYMNDLWQIAPKLKANLGVRYDQISGFTNDSAVEPTVNMIYSPSADTSIRAGYAHYMDMPVFQAFSPQGQASFVGTSNAQPPGQAAPFAQKDQIWDVGVSHSFDPYLSMNFDSYFERNVHYNDQGQFGSLPIYTGFNYGHGTTFGEEVALKYKKDNFSWFLNWTVSRSQQYGVATGQFNFSPAAQAFIASQGLILDHAALDEVSLGTNYKSGPWTFSMQGLYSSGLRGGFANTIDLPAVLQFDLGIQRDFDVKGVGKVSNRLSILNILDRTNLIRPENGIGVFQAGYGPRFTLYDTLTVPLH